MTDRDIGDFVIEVALEAKSSADQEKLALAFKTLAAAAPAFRVSTDQESGQTILSAASELDLDRIVGRLIEEEGVGLLCGAPQVAYREALGRAAEIDHTFARVVGPRGQFARVKIRFEPGERGSGYRFENAAVADAVPDEYIPGVEKGLVASKDLGLLAGFPLVDFKATLIDGAYHDVDSSILAFEMAARMAFKELREKASPMLLEPIMTVDVTTPADCARPLLADLSRRRGEIQTQDVSGDAKLITALVPLANMFGYGRDLQGISQDRASFTMRFERYEPLPFDLDEPPGPFAPAAAMRA